ETCNGFTELFAFFRVAQSSVIAIHSSAQCSPCNTVTSLIEAAQRPTHPRYSRKKVGFRDAHIIKHQFAGSRCPQAPFVVRLGRGESFHAPFHDQSLYVTLRVLRPYHRNISKWCIRYPQLGSIQG